MKNVLRDYNRNILAQSKTKIWGNKKSEYYSIFNCAISVGKTVWICTILCVEEREIGVQDKNAFLAFLHSFFKHSL